MLVTIWISYIFHFTKACIGFSLFWHEAKWIRLLISYIYINFGLLITTNTLAFNGINNSMVMQLISWNSFVFYALIFYNVLDTLKLKKIVLTSTFVQLILIILINLTIEPITVHPALTYTVINSGIVLNTLLVFNEIYQEEKVVFLERNPVFWFNSATLILFCSTIVVFLIRNYNIYVLKNNSLEFVLSTIISFIYALNHIMSIVALLMIKKEAVQSTGNQQLEKYE